MRKPSRASSRKVVLLLATLLSLIVLPGCWSRRELNRTGFVVGFGLDKVEEKKIDMSLQVAIPALIGGGKEGGGGGSGGEQPPVWIGSGSGPTVFEAVRALNTRANDPLFWAHARVFVISEEAAKRGIRPVLDFLFRQPQIRPEVYVAVTPEVTSEIMKINSPQEKVPAFYLANVLEQAHLHARSTTTQMVDVRRAFFEPWQGWAAPMVRTFSDAQEAEKKAAEKTPKAAEADKDQGKEGEKSGEGGKGEGGDQGGGEGKKPKELQVTGLAVFKDERMVGTLSPLETIGYNWIMGRIRSTPLTVSFPDPPERVSIEIIGAGSKIDVEPDTINPGNSRFTIAITGEGNIQELASFAGSPRHRPPNQLNKAMSREVANQVRRTVRRVQKDLKADILGFGERYRESVPDSVWKRVAPKWRTYFTEVRVNVQVKLAVRRRGLTLRP